MACPQQTGKVTTLKEELLRTILNDGTSIRQIIKLQNQENTLNKVDSNESNRFPFFSLPLCFCARELN